ncbi:D-alanyl-D-alanine carboxypeptidase family protein [Actinomadura rupiterrae]|uniref:D-alanyl-D-alanine carboxypeptidase family protein n=1 Tax=Actinomadura rupiterrae TaxID=559627 RepID=UPI0020A3B186|nr:D-alanyl-D-alanine carboxypeptidase [Actinomadura rupiterrae]MCP2335474.1 D-alanyl-D-alanine carboxypeptidase (penicillin-binding protein 5/6) [Actinomadura rupiterrae]
MLAAAAATASAAVLAVPGAACADAGPVGGPQLASRGTVVNPAAGVPAPPNIHAASWVVADADTGEVLAAKDPHGQYLPASTLKTLTALTLIPKLDAARKVRPSQGACDVEGTKVGMTPKMDYTVDQLFHALMMMSANDAAVTLSEANGGLKKTIADMNAEAKDLHAGDTLAASPNGLDVDLGLTLKTQHTSAYDLALILRQGMKNPAYRKYVQALNYWFPAPPDKDQKKKHKPGGYPIYTHNRMLPGQPHAYTGMLGGKNGYTVTAEQTFVAEARRGGHTILISLMKADIPPSPYAAKLLDWGFQARGKVKPVGTLVEPGDGAKADGAGGAGGNGQSAIEKASSSRTWMVVGGGAIGALIAIGVLFLVLQRRHRRGDLKLPRPDGPSAAPDAPAGNVRLAPPPSGGPSASEAPLEHADQGEYAPADGQLPPEPGHFPAEDGQFPAEHGAFPAEHGGFPAENGQLLPEHGEHVPEQGAPLPEHGEQPPAGRARQDERSQ